MQNTEPMSDTKTEHQRAQVYYDDFSTGYENERGRGYHQLIDDLELKAIRPWLPGARVLEVGCGTGLLLQHLAKESAEAWGVDISPGMLEKAKARGLNGVEGTASQIPFPDDHFDVVCSFKVLAHVPDIEEALVEMARVTKPGGLMALEFYNPLSIRYLAKRIAGPQPISDTKTEADVFTRWDTPGKIKQMLPAGTHLEGFRGVRVLTPAAFVHKVPVLRDVIAKAEHAALNSPFAYMGGFLVALVRKTA